MILPTQLRNAPCAEVYNTHRGILAPGTRAPPTVTPRTGGARGVHRAPAQRFTSRKCWLCILCSSLKTPLKEAQALLTLAAGAAPPPHLLRVLPDEQKRNAHPAAAALRAPPPDHRTESAIGVARLKLHQASGEGDMGQGQARLQLKRQGPPPGTLACIPSSQMSLGCIWHVA